MPTDTTENKALAIRFGEAMNTRQLELLDEIVTPDFRRHCQATPDVVVNSLDAFKDFLREDARVFPDSVQTVQHLVAEGDMVAVWATYEGTQRGQLGPFPASGNKMRLDFGAFLRIQDGKIAELWVTWDTWRDLPNWDTSPAAKAKTE